MTRARHLTLRSLRLAASLILAISAPAAAQNYSSAGQSWAGVFGFNTASDRSVALQRAEAIRNAEEGDPQVVYNTNNYNDNRSNYIEVDSGGGTISGSSQIGDAIGEQTYSVGALNTGSTTITVEGDNNSLVANNTAESSGCVDGSIVHSSTTTSPGAADANAYGGLGSSYTLPYVTVTDSGQVNSACAIP